MTLKESGLKVFKIVDANGSDYCVLAVDMRDAYTSYKQFIVNSYPQGPSDPDEWEDPQQISLVGDFLINEFVPVEVVSTPLPIQSVHDAAAGEQLHKDSGSSAFRDPAPIDDIPF